MEHYFKFFGLPVSFQVDESALRKQFYANSKRFHPDFHTLSDETHQAAMLEQSTYNNEGYKILSDADRRMRYILELKGVLGEEGQQQPPLPQDFLMAMMEINEGMMELEFDFQPALWTQVQASLVALEEELDGSIAPILANWIENAPDSAAQLEKVRDYFLKKRYLLRIRENLHKFAAA